MNVKLKRVGVLDNECDIRHENGDFWVWHDRSTGAYTVYKAGVTHSVADSTYEASVDGFSLAVARCNYLAEKRNAGSRT